ncbi:MAG: hypothetical protein MI824_22175 [Hyphomicrobiales bacterium]|nr:hypothetical protein [Hyphomicrobiales bacterium]
MATAVGVSGCNYSRSGAPDLHFADWKTEPPRGNVVTVCHAYGCQRTSRVSFSRADVKAIGDVMRKTKKADTPAEERRAIAYAIAWIEKKVGAKLGTSADRPGMDYRASGDPTQQDCVDEATNTTAYLMFLHSKGLIKYHTVQIPFSKGNILRGVKYWPHWTAVLEETNGGQRYAVDSWIYKNGENPAIVKVEEWYINDLDNLPGPTT